MKRVVIVEPAHSHEEVILPQVELLRESFEVFVVAPRSLLDVDLLSRTSHLYHARAFHAPSYKSRLRRGLGKLPSYLDMRKIIGEIDPDVIIFNSTYIMPEMAFIHWLFRKYRKVQIIHNFQKFLAPFARRLYRAFDGNLVISEEVHKYVTANHADFSDLDYFLPIFFDSFLSAGGGPVCASQAPSKHLRLGVFGSIDDDRRNYRGLMDALSGLGLSPDKAGFRVYLVGKAPPEIQAYIREHNLQGIVEYFTEFVPFGTMFTLLAEMDIVLFLIDREVKNSRHYNRYKISGTSTLVKAFKKVGASSTDFLVDESLSDTCFYYPGTDIGNLLRRIGEGAITSEDVGRKAAAYEGQGMFSFARQRERLVSIIQRVTCS